MSLGSASYLRKVLTCYWYFIFFAMELQSFLGIVSPCSPQGSTPLPFHCALNYSMCITPSNTLCYGCASDPVWKSCALCEMQVSLPKFWDKVVFFFLRVCEDFYVKKQVILYALLIVIKQVNTQKRTQLFCIKLFVLVGYADVLERE